MKRHRKKDRCYDFYVTKSHVVNALLYKIQNDKYYSDVQLDHDSISTLPEACIDVSSQLHFVSTKIDISPLMDSYILDLENHIATQPSQATSTFSFRLPNTYRDMEKIKDFIHTTSMTPHTTIDWLDIGSSPINKYNIEGLFDIAFPILFPNGDVLPHQACIKNISLDTYAVHLMRYHDNRFGSHPRFRYYLYNFIVCHRSQTTYNLFIKHVTPWF